MTATVATLSCVAEGLDTALVPTANAAHRPTII
jgi:hypothetical protein